MLQRASVPTAPAELLLVRMRAKVDDLCRERNALKKAATGQATHPIDTSGPESWFTLAEAALGYPRHAAYSRGERG